MIPDNVETITMTKEDYDRNIEQLLVEKLELEQRIDKAIKYIEEEQWFAEDYEDILINDNIVDTTKLLEILKGEDKE